MSTWIKRTVIAAAIFGVSAISYSMKSWAQQESTLSEWPLDRSTVWHGKVIDIKPTGLDSWLATWPNNVGQVNGLSITLDKNQKKITIVENPPNQHWIGDYEVKNGAYYVKGKEVGGKFTFEAILVLP